MSETPVTTNEVKTPAESNAPRLALTLALLTFSFLLFLGWQVLLSWQQSRFLGQQRNQRETLVAQSINAQNGLQKLAMDLLELAKTDAEARAVVGKFKISHEPNPPNPPR